MYRDNYGNHKQFTELRKANVDLSRELARCKEIIEMMAHLDLCVDKYACEDCYIARVAYEAYCDI